MKITKTLVLILVAMLLSTATFAQKVGVKTNLLYDATSTMNLGVEFSVYPKWTMDVSGNYNPWTFSDNRKMKHWMVQPEARFWLCENFNGHFFGLHLHGGVFNFGGMLPWGFNSGKMFGGVESRNISNYRYEGWFVGAGVAYGYQWILSPRWGIEATVGAGYAYLDYGKYIQNRCGKFLGNETKHYFGLTKLGITLIYIIK